MIALGDGRWFGHQSRSGALAVPENIDGRQPTDCFPVNTWMTKLHQQMPCRSIICSLEAFREPLMHRCEHSPRLTAAVLLSPELRKARRCPQFPSQGGLPARHFKRPGETFFSAAA